MTELIDIFNANHERIGVCDQASVHRQGLWHQTFHCWIVSCHDDAGYLLLQLRSATKKDHPNTLDVTAAGHLAAGEQALDGLRELEEELGVFTEAGDLRYLGIKHDIMDRTHGVRNREFAHVYILRDDRPIEEYRLQEDEVSGLVEVSIEDGLALFAGYTMAELAEAYCLPYIVPEPQEERARYTITP